MVQPKRLLTIVLAILAISLAFSTAVELSTPDLITLAGYPVKEYKVETEDGYILGVFRIPPNLPTKKIVLFVHGLATNSACYCGNLPNNTMSFMMADRGYDVWLINCRGTRYSMEHKTLSPDDKAFWDFSFTEFGLKDVPATMDLIRKETSEDNLSIVAHSEGTSNLFAMLSRLPDYSSRVNVYLALSPAAYVSHTKQELFILADKLKLADVLVDLGVSHISGGPLGEFLPEWFCSQPLAEKLCEATIEWMAGWDPSHLNPDRVGIYANFIDGSSTKNLVHGFQCMDSMQFKDFDYGSAKKNEEHYGAGVTVPPPFNLTEITIPVVLYYGGVDKFVVPEDVEDYLIPALSNCPLEHHLIEPYNHIDPILAWDGVYDDMISDIDRHN